MVHSIIDAASKHQKNGNINILSLYTIKKDKQAE